MFCRVFTLSNVSTDTTEELCSCAEIIRCFNEQNFIKSLKFNELNDFSLLELQQNCAEGAFLLFNLVTCYQEWVNDYGPPPAEYSKPLTLLKQD